MCFLMMPNNPKKKKMLDMLHNLAEYKKTVDFPKQTEKMIREIMWYPGKSEKVGLSPRNWLD